MGTRALGLLTLVRNDPPKMIHFISIPGSTYIGENKPQK